MVFHFNDVDFVYLFILNVFLFIYLTAHLFKLLFRFYVDDGRRMLYSDGYS